LRINDYRERGYIFIDVLMAIFIFAMGFAGLYSLTSEALANYQSSVNLTKAAHLAQSKLALAEIALKNSLSEKSIELGEEISGVEAGMAWTLHATHTMIPNLFELKVVVAWQERNQYQTYLSECLVFVDP